MEKKHQKRKNLNAENKKLRKELKQKRKQLKEQKDIDERISNIYNVNSQKEANRRFNTIHNQINEFDEDTQKFLKNLDKNSTKPQHISETPKYQEQTINLKDILK